MATKAITIYTQHAVSLRRIIITAEFAAWDDLYEDFIISTVIRTARKARALGLWEV